MPARIALLVWPAYAYFRGVLRGISHFARNRPEWSLAVQPNTAPAASAVAGQDVAAVIADVDTPAMAAALNRLRRPVVSISHMIRDARLARVGVDDQAVGRMAAGHFVQRGFASFAFWGIAGRAFSSLRGLGFRDAVLKSGGRYSDLLEVHPEVVRVRGRHLANITRQWLLRLPKPVAVLAASDAHAFGLAELCRQWGIRIPEELSLLGVDDDEVFCSLVSPPLSSVIVPSEQIGFGAARLLERLLAGSKPPGQPILLPPVGISTRRSSDIYALDDPDLVTATRFIRDNAHRPIGARDVVAHVGRSRSTLEHKFRHDLGRTMLAEIRRVRIGRACDLLANTDLPVAEIAARTGFGDQAWLATVFRASMGSTPSAYRLGFRPESLPNRRGRAEKQDHASSRP